MGRFVPQLMWTVYLVIHLQLSMFHSLVIVIYSNCAFTFYLLKLLLPSVSNVPVIIFSVFLPFCIYYVLIYLWVEFEAPVNIPWSIFLTKVLNGFVPRTSNFKACDFVDQFIFEMLKSTNYNTVASCWYFWVVLNLPTCRVVKIIYGLMKVCGT